MCVPTIRWRRTDSAIAIAGEAGTAGSTGRLGDWDRVEQIGLQPAIIARLAGLVGPRLLDHLGSRPYSSSDDIRFCRAVRPGHIACQCFYDAPRPAHPGVGGGGGQPHFRRNFGSYFDPK